MCNVDISVSSYGGFYASEYRVDISVCLNSTYIFCRQTPVSSFLLLQVFRRLFQFSFDLSFIPSLWSFHTSFQSTIYRYTCFKTTVVIIVTVSVRLLSIYRYVHCLYITVLSPSIPLVYTFYISLHVSPFQTVVGDSNPLFFTTLKSLFSQMCSQIQFSSKTIALEIL